MIRSNPPRWLESLLLLLLPERDRETISGDLLELYREGKLPATGRLRANIWYARQIVSFAPHWLGRMRGRRTLLALVCVCTALSGSWLGIIDLVFRHPASHEIISITIVTESVLTLAVLARRQPGRLRVLALGGCAGLLYLGVGALIAALAGAVLEGYILLIALSLILQSLLTLLTLRRPPESPKISAQPL